jgi:hypothetical protein
MTKPVKKQEPFFADTCDVLERREDGRGTQWVARTDMHYRHLDKEGRAACRKMAQRIADALNAQERP